MGYDHIRSILGTRVEVWAVKRLARRAALVIQDRFHGPIPARAGQPWRPLRCYRLRRAYPDKEVVFYDERFTSVIAHRTMLESGMGKMARRDKALVDKISATIILQGYMESRS